MSPPKTKQQPSFKSDNPKKKRKRDMAQADKYYRHGEPKDIIGLVEIEGSVYVLVEWDQVGQAYIPYQFMKKHYAIMVLDYFQHRGRFKKY